MTFLFSFSFSFFIFFLSFQSCIAQAASTSLDGSNALSSSPSSMNDRGPMPNATETREEEVESLLLLLTLFPLFPPPGVETSFTSQPESAKACSAAPR